MPHVDNVSLYRHVWKIVNIDTGRRENSDEIPASDKKKPLPHGSVHTYILGQSWGIHSTYEHYAG